MAISSHTVDMRFGAQMAPETDTERERRRERTKKEASRSQHSSCETANRITAVVIFVGLVWLGGWFMTRIMLALLP